MSTFCTQCGTPRSTAAAFCASCGAKQAVVAAATQGGAGFRSMDPPRVQPAPPMIHQPQPMVPPAGPMAGVAGGATVVPKNGPLYALVSVFLPGVGTMIAGKVGMGLLFTGIWVMFLLSTVFFSFIPFVGWLLLLGVIPLWIGFHAFQIYYAYATAKRWNAERGIIS